MKNAIFIQYAICEGSDLYSFDDKGYPGMYYGTNIVPGEVYYVSEALLSELVNYEGDEYEIS